MFKLNKLISYIQSFIKDKNICILGFGREGKSTLSLFQKIGGYKSITVSDLADLSPTDGAEIISGALYQKNLDRFDIIMKSPGIVMEDGALTDDSKIYSQTELFISVYRDQIIGVTGTKGKSTTSTLIYHVLRECGKNPILLGNIGIPAFDGEITDDNRPIVLELSSHQLEYVNVSPKTAVFLNIFPEHLDHYKSYQAYFNAKKNIYRYQKEGDVLIAHESVLPPACGGRVISFGKGGDIIISEGGFTFFGEEFLLPEDSSSLLGSHNVNNIASAYAVCQSFGVERESFFAALKTYRPLPHRLERIGEKDGIIYYDDSISTIPQTAIQALLSLKNVGTLLVGGMDRGVDYSPLISFLPSFDLPNLVLMYDSGKRIYSELGKLPNTSVHLAKDLAEAVEIAKKVTPKGFICLLSPASASYGFFKNFEERGEKFKEYALN